MTDFTSRTADSDAPRLVRLTALVVLGLLGLRLIALTLDPNALYADETQYWLWAQTLDWGYFSKPPMIAWLIALTTGVFGDADWAVRLSAPILHTITATMLGLTAARLYGVRAGAWTALVWATLPAVWLSSTIISTDAVLLAGVSTALYALIRLREGPDWRFALLLGAAAGYAFLSKYAAIYLLIGLGLSVVVDAPARRALLSWQGVSAAALFGVIISGNVIWNAQHDFATVSHTAANANWNPQTLFRPQKMMDFLTGQLGVFGPLLFPMLVWAMISAFRGLTLDLSAARPRLMLTLFSAPVLLIVTVQSFISRAHANWAAVAYAAGIILVIGYLLEGARWHRWVLYASVALHTVAGLILLTLAASTSLSDAAGVANAFKRVRGWPETVTAVEEAARQAEVSALIFDNRNDFHQMQRYGAWDLDAMFMWPRHDYAQNFAEQGWSMPEGYEGEVLVVSERPWEAPLIAWDFEQFAPAGEIIIELGGNRQRVYALYRAQGYARQVRDADYEIRARQAQIGLED